MMRLRASLMIFLLLVTLGGSGCVRNVDVHMKASHCLNPPEGYCTADGSNSLLLEVRVYQLAEYVDPTKLGWEDLILDDNAFVVLKDFLTDPDKPSMVKSRTFIQHGEERTLQFRRLKGTRYMLVVAVGCRQGEHSIAIGRLKRLQRLQALDLNAYDVIFVSTTEARNRGYMAGERK